MVLLDSKYRNMEFDHVLADNFGSMFAIGKRLMELGHTRIGYVGSCKYSYSFSERLRGLSAALKAGEASVTLMQLWDDSMNDEQNFAHIEEVMKKSNRPTALVCANDDIAILLYDVLKKISLRIPQDVSVTGFDNRTESSYCEPPLTTVRVYKAELAALVVETLMKRVEYPDRHPVTVLLGTELIERKSVSEKR